MWVSEAREGGGRRRSADRSVKTSTHLSSGKKQKEEGGGMREINRGQLSLEIGRRREGVTQFLNKNRGRREEGLILQNQSRSVWTRNRREEGGCDSVS